MLRINKKFTFILALVVLLLFTFSFTSVFASNSEEVTTTSEETPVVVDSAAGSKSTGASIVGSKAIGASIAISLAAAGGAIGMGMGIGKAAEGIAKQPEAEGKIRTTLMLGLVFIETVVIYALVVAILVIFVL